MNKQTKYYVYKDVTDNSLVIIEKKFNHDDYKLITPDPRPQEEILDVVANTSKSVTKIFDYDQFIKKLYHKSNTNANVLWISVNPPLPVQIKELEDNLGNIEITRYSEKIESNKHLIEIIEYHNSDYVIPILAKPMIAFLVGNCNSNRDYIVLYAEMKMLHDENNPDNCPEYDSYRDVIVDNKQHYRFDKFVKLNNVRFEKEVL